MPWCHAEYSAACRTEWDRGTSYPFLVVEPDSHKVLGSVDINQINRDHNFGLCEQALAIFVWQTEMFPYVMSAK